MNRPDVYSYHDYRVFLKDWMAYLKHNDASFSFRKFAILTNMSHGYLPLILNGHRKFTKKAINNILPNIQLKPAEQSYLKLLIQLGDADSQDDRLDAIERIQRFRVYKELNPKETETYQYLTKWYYVAIREMVAIPEFSLDPKWIQEQLSYQVSIGEIKKALEFLISHNFIEVRPDGSARHPNKNVKCVDGIYRVALSQYYKDAFALASQSIDQVPREQRNIRGYVIPLSESLFEKMKTIMDEAIRKIEQLQEIPEDPEAVYYVSMASFPLAVTKKKKRKENAA